MADLENHPRAVMRLARGRELLGNPGSVLARARDFAALAGVVGRTGAQVPSTLGPGEPAPSGRPWLRKPARGGGGSGVRELAPGARVSVSELAQERIEGELGSLSFVADGRRAVLLGVAQGLSGDPAFGARGYDYCGSLHPWAIEDRLLARLDAVVQEATRTFGLVGLNGLDFVVRDGTPYVLEVNPRYSASMELMERSGRFSVFGLHVEACRGVLPGSHFPGSSPRPGVFGKAILWARRNVVLGDTRPWLARDDVRDIPFPGDAIRRGHPICTVFARGDDIEDCRRRLAEIAGALREGARDRAGPGMTRAQIGGRAATVQEAVTAAAALLRRARFPLVFGLVHSTVEAQRQAVCLAESLRGAIDVATTPARASALTAFAQAGLVTASLGAVGRRADLVLFWGCDPDPSIPAWWRARSGSGRGDAGSWWTWATPRDRRGRTSG